MCNVLLIVALNFMGNLIFANSSSHEKEVAVKIFSCMVILSYIYM